MFRRNFIGICEYYVLIPVFLALFVFSVSGYAQTENTATKYEYDAAGNTTRIVVVPIPKIDNVIVDSTIDVYDPVHNETFFRSTITILGESLQNATVDELSGMTTNVHNLQASPNSITFEMAYSRIDTPVEFIFNVRTEIGDIQTQPIRIFANPKVNTVDPIPAEIIRNSRLTRTFTFAGENFINQYDNGAKFPEITTDNDGISFSTIVRTNNSIQLRMTASSSTALETFRVSVTTLGGVALSPPIEIVDGPPTFNSATNPILSAPVGIIFEPSSFDGFGGGVGVIVGPSLAPSFQQLFIGQTNIIRIDGYNLQNVNSIQISPSDNIVIDSYLIADDGESISITITVDGSAAEGFGEMIISTPNEEVLDDYGGRIPVNVSMP